MKSKSSDILSKIILIGLFAIFVINSITNKKFFVINIGQFSTIFLTFIVAFYVGESHINNRKRVSNCEAMLDNFAMKIEEFKLEVGNEKNMNKVLMHIKSTRNDIYFLEKYSRDLKFENELQNLKNTYECYENELSEQIISIADSGEIPKSVSKHVVNIRKECQELTYYLFKR